MKHRRGELPYTNAELNLLREASRLGYRLEVAPTIDWWSAGARRHDVEQSAGAIEQLAHGPSRHDALLQAVQRLRRRAEAL